MSGVPGQDRGVPLDGANPQRLPSAVERGHSAVSASPPEQRTRMDPGRSLAASFGGRPAGQLRDTQLPTDWISSPRNPSGAVSISSGRPR